MVTWENYEEYLVMQADGELDAAGREALEAFLQAHPEVRDELALYETVRLSPDESLVYGDKRALLKEAPKGMIVHLGQWFRYGAVAGLALLVAFGVMKWQGTDDHTPIAKESTPHEITPTAKDSTTTTHRQKEELLVREDAPKAQPLPDRRLTPRKALSAIGIVKETRQMEALPQRIAVAATELNVQRATKVPSEVSLPTPSITPMTAPEPNREDLLAWLPVDEDRKQGLSLLSDAISERVEKVKELRNNIRNTDISVSLGKKELFTVRF